jgi:cofilin
MSTLTFDEACAARFEELKIRRRHRYLVYKLEEGGNKIEVDKIGARELPWESLKSVLPERDCRFAVYDHEFDTDRGVKANKLWFIIWAPFNATASKKMAMAACKTRFQEAVLPGCFEVQAASLEELEENIGFKKVDLGGNDDFDFDD